MTLCFKQGREDDNDNVRSCHPSMSAADENIETVQKMILDNRRNTITEIPDDVSVLFGNAKPFLRKLQAILSKNNVAWKLLRVC